MVPAGNQRRNMVRRRELAFPEQFPVRMQRSAENGAVAWVPGAELHDG